MLAGWLAPVSDENSPVAVAPALGIRAVFRRFWPYARPYRRWFGVLLMLLVLVPLLDTLAIWTWKLMVDDVLVPRRFDPFWTIMAMFVTLTMVGAVLKFADDYLSTWLGERFVLTLRTSVFRHLERLSPDFYTRSRQGDVQVRLSGDVAAIQTFVLSGPTQGIAAVVRILFFAGALFVIQWQLAVVTLAATPILLGVTRHLARLRQQAAREQRRRSGAVATVAEDALSNMTLVQCCRREDYEAQRLDAHGQGAMRAQLVSTKIAGIYRLVVQVIELAGGMLVIGVGVWMLSHQMIPLGGLLVFLVYLAELYSPIRGLGKLTTTLFTAAAGAERVIELLDQEPEVQDRPEARPLPRALGRIRLQDVSYRYPDTDRPALDGVSFTAEPGEIIALTGPSGAGKSTLARLLVRFYDPDSGTVRLDGHDLRDLRLADVRHHVALLSQDALLLNTTVSDNISYGRVDADLQRVVEAARAADADQFIRRLPHGYESRVGHSGRRLSGGQRQRVAIARAILQDAPVLVLDEPGTALDAASLRRLLAPLRRLVQGRTTIVISHNLLLAREADRIFVLDAGRIIDSGTHDSLLQTCDLYARLWNLHRPDAALVVSDLLEPTR
jgi:ATP-binding cassette subfamily B protein